MKADLCSILFMFELMGLNCFSLKTLSLAKNTKFERPSVYRAMYISFLIGCLSALSTVFTSPKDPWTKKDRTAKNVLMLTVKNSIGVLLLLGIFTSLVESYLSAKYLKKFFFNVTQINNISYEKFEICVDYKNVNKRIWKRFVVMTVLFLILHATPIIIRTQLSRDYTRIGIGIAGAIPMFMVMMVLFKFVFYVDLVHIQLDLLNKVLKKVNVREPAKTIAIKNILFVPFEDANSRYKDCFMRLWTAKKIYFIINENGELINKSVGYTMLISFVTLVVLMTCSGYEIFIISIGGYPFDKIYDAAYCAVVSFLFLVIAVLFCNRIQLAMIKILRTIKNLELNSFNEVTIETRELLQNFMSELIHQPVAFTIQGFYTINLALLASIATGIVSYQVILIQFYAST